MISPQFYVEWSSYRLRGSSPREQAVLMHTPQNLFQLAFWLEPLIIAKLQEREIPDSAIFYLHDEGYLPFFSNLNQNEQIKIKFKIDLCKHILSMSVFSSLARQVEEIHLLATILKHQSQLDSLKSWLMKNTHFECQRTVQLIGEYLQSKISGEQNMNGLSDISLSNIIIKQLCNDEISGEGRREWIQFLVNGKKPSICSLLKENLMKSSNPANIEFYFQLLDKFELLQDQRLINTSDNFDALTDLFFNLGQRISKFPYFQKFMLRSSSIRCACLHQKLIMVPSATNQSVAAKLKSESLSIYCDLIHRPTKTSKQCLAYYLKQSEFIFPQKLKKSELEDWPNPMLITFIHRGFWENGFHGKVLNCVVWMVLESWLNYVESLMRREEGGKGLNFNEYKVQLQLTLLQFMFGLPVGNFLNYYPTEMNLEWNLIGLPSFSSLCLSNEAFMEISWFSLVVNSELKSIINQEDGIELGYKILTSVTDYEKHFRQFLLNFIESKFSELKRDPRRKQKAHWMRKITEFYMKESIHEEKAHQLHQYLIQFN